MKRTNLWMGQGSIFASVIFWNLISLAGCQSGNSSTPGKNISDNDTIVPAIIHRLADLPDSLQPREIFMADKRGPIEIPVPVKKSSFSFISYTGIPVILPQEPPVTKSLPVVVNHNGDTVVGADGHPMLLGTGGRAFFSHFNSENGLPLDGIQSSLMDSKGNYWVGTQGAGLSRFDGKKFTNFNIAHGLAGSFIYCLVEDRRGNIWIGTENGLSRFDGRSFKNFNKHEELKRVIFDILEDDDGTFWVATYYNGLIRFGHEEGHSPEKVLAVYDTTNGLRGQGVGHTLKDNAGKVWIANGPYLSRFDGKRFTHFIPDDGQGYLQMQKIVKAGSGNFWLGTTRGLFLFNPKDTGTLLPFTNDARLSGKWINSLFVASSGKLWIGTADDGLHVFDGTQFTSFTKANGLPSNSVRSIQEDKNGHIWIGTNGGGISVFKDPSFSNFTSEHGFPFMIWGALEASDGNFWYATSGGGIAKKAGHTITYYGDKQGLLNGTVLDIHKDNFGNIWVGFRGGFGLFDGKFFRSYTRRLHGLPGGAVSCLIPATGGYWVGAEQGLSRVKLEKEKRSIHSLTNYSKAQGLSDPGIRTLTEDHNLHLWIGTDNGLNYFDGSSFRIFNQVHGLPDERIQIVCFDSRGNIWVGTVNGLAFADSVQLAGFINGSLPGIRFHSYNTSDGLPDNSITALLELPEGKMVAGTNEGIAMFDLPETKAKDYDKLQGLNIFNAASGYPVRDVNAGPKAMTLDSKGVLWIATGSDRTSLVRFDYRALNKNKKPTTVSIHRLLINEEPFPWSVLNTKNNAADTSGKTADEEFLADEMSNFGRALSSADRDSLRSRFTGIRFDSILPFSYLPQKLVLPYRHNQVSFEFGSNELANPGMVEYQYMLEGYNREWSLPLKQTSATFGNIREGNHTFKVRARFTGAGEAGSNDWSEEARLTFNVLPPWYRSWWAYTIYAMLIGLVLWRIQKYQKMRTIRKVREAAQAKELAQAKEIEKAYAELKMTQQQLVQSEKMASLGELTAGIAHEIQNPLNFVNNFSDLNTELIAELMEEIENYNLDEASAIASNIKINEQKINNHGKRADAIVKGMLQHGRISTGIKEPTDINGLADEYLRLSYHGLRAKEKLFNSTIKTEFDPTIGNIPAIPQDIGRVLLNLYNNAFYAVDEKSKKLNGSYTPTVWVSTKKLPGHIEIRVSDNGEGIPKKVFDKIFQPFFTTKPTGQGTGLGLSLSYDIVKAHGGEFKVETKEGEGSEFIIQLPHT